VLPFTGLKSPSGVAVDAAGSVYVTDQGNARVVRLPSGSASQEVLPFTDLVAPWAIALDTVGSVYVTDVTNLSVVKLPAR
jgi:serine/threonine-protein kinase